MVERNQLDKLWIIIVLIMAGALLIGLVSLLVVQSSQGYLNNQDDEVASALKSSQYFQGQVIDVHDGDTVTIQTDSEVRRVRMAGIDAPELKQQDGEKARDGLRWLIAGKSVTVRYAERDRYRRYVGLLFPVNGELEISMNEIMLRSGLAWHYKQYDKTPSFAASETAARADKIGIWANPDIVPPWEFRRQR